MQLILASGSRYKAELLGRLHLRFTAVSSDVDETPQHGESPRSLASRLADMKAAAVRPRFPAAVIIGADQVATSAVMPLIGKPGTRAANAAMLLQLAGQRVSFHTALTLDVPSGGSMVRHRHLDTTVVTYRQMSTGDIAHYLDLEDATDCAGGYKVEGLGISLLDSVEGHDPTALIGLPLIALARLLRELNVANDGDRLT
jgi:septum formation protein